LITGGVSGHDAGMSLVDVVYQFFVGKVVTRILLEDLNLLYCNGYKR